MGGADALGLFPKKMSKQSRSKANLLNSLCNHKSGVFASADRNHKEKKNEFDHSEKGRLYGRSHDSDWNRSWREFDG